MNGLISSSKDETKSMVLTNCVEVLANVTSGLWCSLQPSQLLHI